MRFIFSMTGPVRPPPSPPGLSGAYTSADFTINWDARTATCPADASSIRWIDTYTAKGSSSSRTRTRKRAGESK